MSTEIISTNAFPQSPFEWKAIQQYQFNVTGGLGVETVILEHNFTNSLQNTTVSLHKSTEYYISFENLDVNVYQYRFFIMDSDNVWNSTDIFYYFVNDTIRPKYKNMLISLNNSFIFREDLIFNASIAVYDNEGIKKVELVSNFSNINNREPMTYSGDVAGDFKQYLYVFSQNLPVNTYLWQICITDTSNNVNCTKNQSITVLKQTPTMNLTINGLSNNITVFLGKKVDILGTVNENASIPLQLYVNDDLLNSSEKNVSASIYPRSLYNFTVTLSFTGTNDFSPKNITLAVKNVREQSQKTHISCGTIDTSNSQLSYSQNNLEKLLCFFDSILYYPFSSLNIIKNDSEQYWINITENYQSSNNNSLVYQVILKNSPESEKIDEYILCKYDSSDTLQNSFSYISSDEEKLSLFENTSKTILNLPDQLINSAKQFNDTTCIGNLKDLYHLDQTINNSIQPFNIFETKGNPASGDDQDSFNSISSVLVDTDGNYYVSDQQNRRIIVYNSELRYKSIFPVKEAIKKLYLGKNNDLYLIFPDEIQQLNKEGTFINSFSISTEYLAFGNNQIYTVNPLKNTISVYDENFNFQKNITSFTHETISKNIRQIGALGVDKDDNVYFADNDYRALIILDSSNNIVQFIDGFPCTKNSIVYGTSDINGSYYLVNKKCEVITEVFVATTSEIESKYGQNEGKLICKPFNQKQICYVHNVFNNAQGKRLIPHYFSYLNNDNFVIFGPTDKNIDNSHQFFIISKNKKETVKTPPDENNKTIKTNDSTIVNDIPSIEIVLDALDYYLDDIIDIKVTMDFFNGNESILCSLFNPSNVIVVNNKSLSFSGDQYVLDGVYKFNSFDIDGDWQLKCYLENYASFSQKTLTFSAFSAPGVTPTISPDASLIPTSSPEVTKNVSTETSLSVSVTMDPIYSTPTPSPDIDDTGDDNSSLTVTPDEFPTPTVLDGESSPSPTETDFDDLDNNDIDNLLVEAETKINTLSDESKKSYYKDKLNEIKLNRDKNILDEIDELIVRIDGEGSVVGDSSDTSTANTLSNNFLIIIVVVLILLVFVLSILFKNKSDDDGNADTDQIDYFNPYPYYHTTEKVETEDSPQPKISSMPEMVSTNLDNLQVGASITEKSAERPKYHLVKQVTNELSDYNENMSVDDLLRLGTFYYSNKQRDYAYFYYNKAYEQNPENITALRNLAQLYTEENRFDDAYNCYRRVLAIEEDHEETLVDIGHIYSKKHLYNKAISHFKDLLEKKPDMVHLWGFIGEIYETEGLYKKALDAYEKQAGVMGHNVPGLLKIAYLNAKLLNNDKTLNIMEKIIELEPKNKEALDFVSNYYIEKATELADNTYDDKTSEDFLLAKKYIQRVLSLNVLSSEKKQRLLELLNKLSEFKEEK